MTRKHVTDEQFVEAYGYPHTPPENLTKTQRDNRNIMRAVTNKYANLIPEEDLHTCALQALWRTLGYHKDDMGQRFTTSLWRFTEWECRRELRKRKKPATAPNMVSIMDFEHFDLPAAEVSDDVKNIRECVNLLPKAQKELIVEHFFEKRTMEEIGKLHGCSKEGARQKINKAVRRLQEIYIGKGKPGVSLDARELTAKTNREKGAI